MEIFEGGFFIDMAIKHESNAGKPKLAELGQEIKDPDEPMVEGGSKWKIQSQDPHSGTNRSIRKAERQSKR